MEIIDKKHIILCPSDVEDLIIKALYYSQGISGIFSVNFKIKREFRTGIAPHDSDYVYVFDGADVTVE